MRNGTSGTILCAYTGITIIRRNNLQLRYAQGVPDNPLFYASGTKTLHMSDPKPDLPPAAKPAAKPKAVKKVVSTESRLAKLGLRTDMDLVLHLPMRYEDETKVYTIRDACLRGGESWQVEGIVTKCEVNFKPRKQLLVTIADETGNLLLRFMNFYGSQVKQLAEGTRVRARAELKHGFFGAEMVHPTYKVVNEGAPLPTALTPVYPSGEGLSQHVLRREIADAMRRIDWQDTLPDQLLREMQLSPFRAAVHLLHLSLIHI